MTPLAVGVLEFTRYMDYTLGLTFATAAKKQTIEGVMQDEELIELIKDALVWKPAQLHNALRASLTKKLVLMADEFEDERLFLFMLSLLNAASGDYQTLLIIVEEEKILGKRATEYFFDQEPTDV